MLVLHQATQLAMQRAKRHGVGVVATNNTCSSSGALGCAPAWLAAWVGRGHECRVVVAYLAGWLAGWEGS